ncbi:MAG: leucine-rich repeat domain-containing protein [Roseburia sp.]|nr:leucine-rich repeat domain-containing protein [Roseburia sp.]
MKECAIDGLYKYEFLRDNEVMLTEYCGNDETVVMPDEIDGRAVTAFGNFMFISRNDIKQVTISGGVTSIGDFAFMSCGNLTNIVMPSGLKYIGSETFNRCGNLTSIEIPSGVTGIGDGAFEDCKSLTGIVIPSGVTNIKSRLFKGCRRLTGIEIPSSVESVGADAFEGCDRLQYKEYGGALYLGNSDNPYLVLVKVKSSNAVSCVVNKNTRVIGCKAFAGCSRLTKVEIPDGVNGIGEKAFEGCKKLTIHCQADSQPTGWASDWNSGRPVIWNCKSC